MGGQLPSETIKSPVNAEFPRKGGGALIDLEDDCRPIETLRAGGSSGRKNINLLQLHFDPIERRKK